MSEPAFLTAQFTQTSETTQAELAVTLDNHIEEVWAALTEPDKLAQWLAPGTIELRLGGAARLEFAQSGGLIDSKVTAFEPQLLLEYSWSTPGEPLRPVRWTLEPIGPLTRLTLRLRVPAAEDAARATAGWAAHLEMLQTALVGVAPRYPAAAFKAAREAYSAQLSATAATRQTAPASG